MNVPDAPRDVQAGANATLQIVYTSAFDSPSNETFYACADITYVRAADFHTEIPCFNATEKPVHTTTSAPGTATPTPSSSPAASEGEGPARPAGRRQEPSPALWWVRSSVQPS